jgi:hypothetical protein
MRQLIVGDIHDCFAEFQDLLDRAGPYPASARKRCWA